MVVPVGQKPQEAFIWGKGGQRQSMDAVNRMRQMGEQQMMAGADYSPVNHWTQGLARMSQGLIGGLNMRNANRREDTLLQEQAASQAAQQGQYLEALKRRGMSPEDAAVVVALGPEAIQSAVMPKQEALPEIIRLQIVADDPSQPQSVRDTAKARIQAINDPVQNIAFGDNFFSARQSQMPSLMGIAGYGEVQGPQGQAAPPPRPVGKMTMLPEAGIGQLGAAPSTKGPNGLQGGVTREQVARIIAERGEPAAMAFLKENDLRILD